MKYEWVQLEDVCNFEYGYTEKAKDSGDARFIRITDIDDNGRIREGDKKYVSLTDESRKYLLRANDILVARTGATYGKTAVFKESYPAVFASYLIRLSFRENKVLPEFYWLFAQSTAYWDQAKKLMTGGGQPQFNANAMKSIKIPLVPVEMQRELVEQAEKERLVIDANNHLIEMFEQKIKDRIAKIWGEE
ncbi:MAG: restriction endonuclease subunit S [Candidatus Omnitrophica bacterium CG11_big_fil_rev_8_21_14_0_20_43_6]|nr:MAG: restriction endonuclease subunit S [Candidatus Omnitrophica bacterium CG11_big_fil_rev_8_21_14_0_20_43_6]